MSKDNKYVLYLNNRPYGTGDMKYMSELINDYLSFHEDNKSTKFEIEKASKAELKFPELKYVFDNGDVDRWKHCPMCGSEILEVYPGDYFGHITCFKEEDTCDINFEIYGDYGDRILRRD